MTDKPTDAQMAVDDFTDRNAFEPQPFGPPSPFHNFGQGLGDAAMQGFARVGRTALQMAPAALELMGTGLTDEGKDWYFKNVVDDVGSNAVDHWTPDAQDLGKAGQTLNGLVTGLVPLVAGGGNPVPLLATTAFDQPLDLVKQGVDANTAIKVGAINTAATAVGFKLPFLGKNLWTKLGSGVGGNLAVGEGSRQASAAVLDDAGHAELAEGYRDPTAAWMDVGFGVVFSGLAQAASPNAPKVTPAQRDSYLSARNAWHFQEGSAPGTPVDGVSFVGHQTALTKAVEQFMAGEPVNVADAIPDGGLQFNTREQPARATVDEAAREVRAGEAFDVSVEDVLRAEGGFVDDPIDRGGATNFGISSRAHPGVDVATLTREDAKGIYRREYWDAIDADALPDGLRGAAFDAAVNQGVGWTKGALAEAGGDPVKFLALREARYREIVANDPTQAKFLKGWLNRLDPFRADAEAPRVSDTPQDAPAPVADAPLFPEVSPIARTMAQLDEGGVLINPRDDYRIARVGAGDDAMFHVSPFKGAGEKQTMDRAGVEAYLTERQPQPKPAPAAVPLMRVPEPQAAPAQPARVALDRLATEAPDLMAVSSYDADGAPRYQSMSEAKVDIDAEHTKAVNDAEAYEAAVNCFIRHGEAA